MMPIPMKPRLGFAAIDVAPFLQSLPAERILFEGPPAVIGRRHAFQRRDAFL
jgi:hypothetical protein